MIRPLDPGGARLQVPATAPRLFYAPTAEPRGRFQKAAGNGTLTTRSPAATTTRTRRPRPEFAARWRNEARRRRDIIAISEEVLTELWALPDSNAPSRSRLCRNVRRFGRTKPDLRFGLELSRCSFDTTFRVFQRAAYVGAVVMLAGRRSRRAWTAGKDWSPSSAAADWPC